MKENLIWKNFPNMPVSGISANFMIMKKAWFLKNIKTCFRIYVQMREKQIVKILISTENQVVLPFGFNEK